MIWDGIERRKFVRVQFSFPANIIADNKLMLSACAEDISEEGIKIVTAEELEISSIIDLEIYLGEKPIVCKGKVVRVKKIESEHLRHGVVFDTGIEMQNLSQEDKLAVKNIVDALKQESQQ